MLVNNHLGVVIILQSRLTWQKYFFFSQAKLKNIPDIGDGLSSKYVRSFQSPRVSASIGFRGQTTFESLQVIFSKATLGVWNVANVPFVWVISGDSIFQAPLFINIRPKCLILWTLSYHLAVQKRNGTIKDGEKSGLHRGDYRQHLSNKDKRPIRGVFRHV